MSDRFDLKRFVRRHGDLIVVSFAALAVRLWWDLSVHRPLDYAFSDMGGYLERAQTSIDRPDARLGYFTLFPWGTHWLLSLVKRAFGPQNTAAIGALYALYGAGAVGYGFALARRFTRSAWISRAVGAVLVVYYPWIGLGGYTLSEPPFTLFLGATAFHGLAYADRGRARDAWLFGGALALASIFRPQILIALPLYGLHWLLRRRAWRRFSYRRLLPAIALPLALITVVSAARMRFHTGELGFISRNGPLNFAFGRCHATLISSSAPDRKSSYSPPPLGALGAWGDKHPRSPFKLDPAMGLKLHFEGHIWDAGPSYALARACMEKTGVSGQVKYGLTHVLLLWFFNTAWPDGSQPRFSTAMEVSQALHNVLVLPAALVAMALAFRRRRARAMLLALHVYGLMAVAAVYFGDTRLRAPYDGILITLAATTYASLAGAARRRWAATRPRR